MEYTQLQIEEFFAQLLDVVVESTAPLTVGVHPISRNCVRGIFNSALSQLMLEWN